MKKKLFLFITISYLISAMVTCSMNKYFKYKKIDLDVTNQDTLKKYSLITIAHYWPQNATTSLERFYL